VTIAAQDPISKIPEFKVCAVRVVRQYGPPAYAGQFEAQQ
jgi:assimilatory nitrate reductase catalytic subunit